MASPYSLADHPGRAPEIGTFQKPHRAWCSMAACGSKHPAAPGNSAGRPGSGV